jgi:hypothetical protein
MFAVWSLLRGLLSKSIGTLTAFIYVEVLILIFSVLEVRYGHTTERYRVYTACLRGHKDHHIVFFFT